jgi:hypothetical protein
MDRDVIVNNIESDAVTFPIGTTHWTPILQHSTQVVLWNPESHALAVRPALSAPVGLNQSERPRVLRSPSRCPYCDRPFDGHDMTQSEDTDTNDSASTVDRAHNYFQLLEIANETASRPTTPPLQDRLSPEPQSTSGIAEGYFKTFFKEEARLGMGAGGSVYLCQVSCGIPQSPLRHLLKTSY